MHAIPFRVLLFGAAILLGYCVGPASCIAQARLGNVSGIWACRLVKRSS
jgi:hypothetical protein